MYTEYCVCVYHSQSALEVKGDKQVVFSVFCILYCSKVWGRLGLMFLKGVSQRLNLFDQMYYKSNVVKYYIFKYLFCYFNIF